MSSALARLPYRCGGGSSSKRGEESSHPISFVLATSRLFASRPAYVTEQPPFFNAAAAVVTRLPPLRLLRALKGLERDAGRGKEQGGEPTVRFGPRPLDLDIVFYGGLRGKLFEEENEGEGGSRDADDADADAAAAVSAAVSQGLELPHPRWRERAFVMAPACDLVGGAEEGGAEESELERLGSGLRLFGFNLTGGDDGRRRQRRQRPSLRPPGLPFPLPSRSSAEAVSRSLCEVAQRWRELCCSSSDSSSSSASPEADCRLGGGSIGGGASSCWPVLPLPHGLGGWRAQATRPRMMAVLNVTPDSFSDGGRLMARGKGEASESGSSGSSGGGSAEKSSSSSDSSSSAAAAFEEEEGLGEDPPTNIPAVLAAAHLAVSRGADLLDVGGQSTRPGAARVPEEVEARRVLPAVRALAADERLKSLRIPISVDTFYASVAERALEAGAHIINDVTGGKGDGGEEGKMAAAVARGRGVLILTHNRGGGSAKVGKTKSSSSSPPSSFDPSGGSADSDYGAYGGDVAVGVAEELAEAVESAVAAGGGEGRKKKKNDGGGDDDVSSSSSSLLPWSLALDPGLGFSKTREQNLSLLARTGDVRKALPPQFRTMPVLVGASRKGFLGGGGRERAGGGSEKSKSTAPESAEEVEKEEGSNHLHPRDPATFASSAIAAAHGADLLRVHEVARNREAAGVGAEVRWARAAAGARAVGVEAATEAVD